MNWTERRTSGHPELCIHEMPHPGPTLLLLHGVTRLAEDFKTILPMLAPHWRIIAPDHRGHGGSARAASYLITDYAADAVNLLRNDIGAPVVIHGHSLGAMVAAAVAAEVPQLVRAIVLEDPPFHAMGRHIHSAIWEAQFLGMRDVLRAGGTVAEMADALAEIRVPVGGGFKRFGELRDRASMEWSAECIAHLDPEVITPIVEGRWLDGYDIPATYARIRCPTLLLQADPNAGGALSDTDAKLAQESIAGCRIEHFPGSGHLLHGLQPARIAKLINEFA